MGASIIVKEVNIPPPQPFARHDLSQLLQLCSVDVRCYCAAVVKELMIEIPRESHQQHSITFLWLMSALRLWFSLREPLGLPSMVNEEDPGFVSRDDVLEKVLITKRTRRD
ncbi:unnamed protein product [Heligmosomoides polygyrus]|uniref:Rho-GAP domain-containing protein n=1 Tax=Heligmosomoides polygyrus TaxID=6339 RepID=A0A183FGW1_HELPZ|nr:unnamed protein product [Heligmosomoides polygyrus]